MQGSLKRGLRTVIPRRIKAVASRRLLALRLKGTEGIIKRYRGRLFLLEQDGVTARLLINGDYETDVTDALLERLSPGDAFLDVGANFGWFSILAVDAVGVDGSVLAIDPNRVALSRLRSNLMLNGLEDRVIVCPVAVGAEVGSGMLGAPSATETGRSALIGLTPGDQDGAGYLEQVEIDTVDNVIQAANVPFQKVRVVKVDVEGAETAVLAGAQMLLECDHPLSIFLEARTDEPDRLELMLNQIRDASPGRRVAIERLSRNDVLVELN